MELRTQTELGVGGDGYNDLLLNTECEAGNVYVELLLRYNYLRPEYKAHPLVEAGMSDQVMRPLSR